MRGMISVSKNDQFPLKKTRFCALQISFNRDLMVLYEEHALQQLRRLLPGVGLQGVGLQQLALRCQRRPFAAMVVAAVAVPEAALAAVAVVAAMAAAMEVGVVVGVQRQPCQTDLLPEDADDAIRGSLCWEQSPAMT